MGDTLGLEPRDGENDGDGIGVGVYEADGIGVGVNEADGIGVGVNEGDGGSDGVTDGDGVTDSVAVVVIVDVSLTDGERDDVGDGVGGGGVGAVKHLPPS